MSNAPQRPIAYRVIFRSAEACCLIIATWCFHDFGWVWQPIERFRPTCGWIGHIGVRCGQISGGCGQTSGSGFDLSKFVFKFGRVRTG